MHPNQDSFFHRTRRPDDRPRCRFSFAPRGGARWRCETSRLRPLARTFSTDTIFGTTNSFRALAYWSSQACVASSSIIRSVRDHQDFSVLLVYYFSPELKFEYEAYTLADKQLFLFPLLGLESAGREWVEPVRQLATASVAAGASVDSGDTGPPREVRAECTRSSVDRRTVTLGSLVGGSLRAAGVF